MGVGPTLLRERNIDAYHKKWTGSVGEERPTDTANSREVKYILAKVATDTQSVWVFAPGDDISLDVVNHLSLRALVDCGESNNFSRY